METDNPARRNIASAGGLYSEYAYLSLQSVRGSSMGHCPKELSGAASPHTSLPTAVSDGFFWFFFPAGCWKEAVPPDRSARPGEDFRRGFMSVTGMPLEHALHSRNQLVFGN